MPAKSEAQRKLLNAKFGHAWVKKHHFDNEGKLPAHVKKGKTMAKKHHGKGKLKETGKISDTKSAGHTGKIVHSDMTSLIDGHGSKDPHASAEHHAANAEHDMHHGMSPEGDESGEEGTEGLKGGNSCYE